MPALYFQFHFYLFVKSGTKWNWSIGRSPHQTIPIMLNVRWRIFERILRIFERILRIFERILRIFERISRIFEWGWNIWERGWNIRELWLKWDDDWLALVVDIEDIWDDWLWRRYWRMPSRCSDHPGCHLSSSPFGAKTSLTRGPERPFILLLRLIDIGWRYWGYLREAEMRWLII